MKVPNISKVDPFEYITPGVIFGVILLVFGGFVLLALVSVGLYNPVVVQNIASHRGMEYVAQLNRQLKTDKYVFLGCSSQKEEGHATCTLGEKIEGQSPKIEPLSCTYGLFDSGCSPYTFKRSGGVVVPPQ